MSRDQARVQHDRRWEASIWRGQVRRRLSRWFERNQRVLPWRQTKDPYRVWVSEIMLQQTQVATAIGYFNRFQMRFPNVESLAAADEQEVLRHWEGLGYYRRARQLHAAARQIVSQYEGRFPDQFDQVMGLPGIGRYTAGAVLSISFDQRYPVVEANTQRLYARLIGLREATVESASQRLLWRVAEELLPRKRTGNFNQAAMELGSLVCKPRSPDCATCPLTVLCTAFEGGLQEQVPVQRKRMMYEDRSEVAVVVSNRGKFLVRKCLPGERWAGLWDFPRCEVHNVEDPSASAKRHLFTDYAQQATDYYPLMTIKHGVTKYRITLQVFAAKAKTRQCRSSDQTQWKNLHELASIPLSTTGRKIVNRLAVSTPSAS